MPQQVEVLRTAAMCSKGAVLERREESSSLLEACRGSSDLRGKPHVVRAARRREHCCARDFPLSQENLPDPLYKSNCFCYTHSALLNFPSERLSQLKIF